VEPCGGMKNSIAEKVISLADGTKIKSNSFIASYQSLCEFFQDKTYLNGGDVICGCHMVYGWMPTIVELNEIEKRLNEIVRIVNVAKTEGKISNEDLKGLSSFINNSLVGASKFLHFSNPNAFTIWDSRVYQFIHNESAYQYRISDIDKYREYEEIIHTIELHTRFADFHEQINHKIGYAVSSKRAIELVMFLNSKIPIVT
jgi:hypothetical protein